MSESSTHGCDRTNILSVLEWRANNQANATAFTMLVDGELEEQSLTFAELRQRVCDVAAIIRGHDLSGERLLVLQEDALEFIASFLGCLAAGAVAVPSLPPRSRRHLDRVHGVLSDSGARGALTSRRFVESCSKLSGGRPDSQRLTILASDGLPVKSEEGQVTASLAGAAREASLTTSPQTLAFLQYTSGSTRTPRGVEITQGNLISNLTAIHERAGLGEGQVGVQWLPLFHDMGLVGLLYSIFAGAQAVLLSPPHFTQRPIRWLRAISRYGACYSGGPNFGYALCTENISDEDLAELDLSSWNFAYTGAEPIRWSTLVSFADRFARCGLRTTAFYPCYGLAEATLMVSGGRREERPVVRWFDRAALLDDQPRQAKPEITQSIALVGCGRPLLEHEIVIVEPNRFTRLADGQIGEIWVRGPSTSRGYWNRGTETAATFAGRIADQTQPSDYLRTGDLGFVLDGELFVTGRIKDLLIIRGSSHYPQDVEWTVEQSPPAMKSGLIAAFSVLVKDQEELVVVAEVPRSRADKLDQVVAHVRRSVADAHGLEPHAIVLARVGSVPRTSSGKVRRTLCREQFVTGELRGVIHTSHATHQVEPQVRSARTIEEKLCAEIAAKLQLAADEVDVDQSLVSFGFSSVQAVQVIRDLSDWLERPLEPTLAWDYPSIRSLSRHLAGESVDEETESTQHLQPVEPIAIVGMACRFPGANNLTEYW